MQAAAALLPVDGKKPAYDCYACQNPEDDDGQPSHFYQEPETRASWHCGWMSEAEWTEYRGPERLGRFQLSCRICPGFLARLPQVGEAFAAVSAFRTGQLADLFEAPGQGLANTVVEAAMQLDNALHQVEAERAEESRQRVEHMK